MVNVVYTVRVEKIHSKEVIQIAKQFDFTVKEEEMAVSNQEVLIMNKDFHVDDLERALDLFQVLRGTDGVTQITPIFTPKKSKKPIISIFIATVVIFFAILATMYAISSETNMEEKLVASTIPAIVAFFSQIGYRYFRWY